MADTFFLLRFSRERDAGRAVVPDATPRQFVLKNLLRNRAFASNYGKHRGQFLDGDLALWRWRSVGEGLRKGFPDLSVRESSVCAEHSEGKMDFTYFLPGIIAAVVGILIGINGVNVSNRLSGGAFFGLVFLTNIVARLIGTVGGEALFSGARTMQQVESLMGVAMTIDVVVGGVSGAIVGCLSARRALTIGKTKGFAHIIFVPLIGLLWLTFAKSTEPGSQTA